MAYNCVQLSEPSEGVQSCLEWHEVSTTLLPPMTFAEANQYLIYVVSAFVVVFVVRRCLDLLRY